MKPYTKKLMDFYGYSTGDFIPCETCGREAIDTAHIKAKGMGGSKLKDTIDNLMFSCRECHVRYGDKKQYMDFLKEAHGLFMEDGLSWVERGNLLPGFSEKPKTDIKEYFHEG